MKSTCRTKASSFSSASSVFDMAGEVTIRQYSVKIYHRTSE